MVFIKIIERFQVNDTLLFDVTECLTEDLLLDAMGPTLDVRFWRLWTSEFDV